MVEQTYFCDIPAFASFPYLFKPRDSDAKDEQGKPKYVTYEVTACVVKDHPIWLKFEKQVKALALRVLREKFGDKAEFGKAFHSPFSDGDTDKDLDKYPQYAGKIIIPMRSRSGNNRTGEVDLVDVDGHKLTDERSIYAGCIIVPSFGFYAYDNPKRRGVSAGLRCVRKIADSTPWVSIASAERDYKNFDKSQYAEITNDQMYAGAAMDEV